MSTTSCEINKNALYTGRYKHTCRTKTFCHLGFSNDNLSIIKKVVFTCN